MSYPLAWCFFVLFFCTHTPFFPWKMRGYLIAPTFPPSHLQAKTVSQCPSDPPPPCDPCLHPKRNFSHYVTMTVSLPISSIIHTRAVDWYLTKWPDSPSRKTVASLNKTVGTLSRQLCMAANGMSEFETPCCLQGSLAGVQLHLTKTQITDKYTSGFRKLQFVVRRWSPTSRLPPQIRKTDLRNSRCGQCILDKDYGNKKDTASISAFIDWCSILGIWMGVRKMGKKKKRCCHLILNM